MRRSSEQVLFNLLDNAHKYSDPGTSTEVRLSATPEELTLCVADRGVGIPTEALEKVFDKFYRVAGSDGRAPGTGLGLSICAGIVKAWAGPDRSREPDRRQSRHADHDHLPVAARERDDSRGRGRS